VADLDGEPLDRGSNESQSHEKLGMAVTRDHLGRDRLGLRPSLSATCASTLGSILAKVPTAPEIAQIATASRAATSRAGCGRTPRNVRRA